MYQRAVITGCCALIFPLLGVLASDHKTKAHVPITKSLADLIDSVRPEVVKIAIKADIDRSSATRESMPFNGCFNGGSLCIAGTGFMVNSDGYIVTAFHVMDGFRTKDGRDEPGIKDVANAFKTLNVPTAVVFGVSIPNVDNGHVVIAAGTNYFPATLVATDPEHDLAILKADVNPFQHMPVTFAGPGAKGLPQASVKVASISVDRPRDAEEVFACGYPFGEAGLVITSGSVASAWNTKVLLRAEAAGFAFPVPIYDLDLRINPGNSGGPVFRARDSAVIGIAVETRGTLGIAVPSKFIGDFLSKEKIAWTRAQK